MEFAVVAFTDDNSVTVVPTRWISDDDDNAVCCSAAGHRLQRLNQQKSCWRNVWNQHLIGWHFQWKSWTTTVLWLTCYIHCSLILNITYFT